MNSEKGSLEEQEFRQVHRSHEYSDYFSKKYKQLACSD